jgi:release factor glutamine methyltransferase
MLKLETILSAAKTALIKADVPTPSLDARLLMQYILQIAHADLIANENRQLTDDQANSFQTCLNRRLAGEPVSRILGTREFYGRSFKTSPAVLDPRPDTETLVDLCLEHLQPDQHKTILDLGTGSGILALTLLAERPDASAVASDISPAACAIADSNAAVFNLSNRIVFIESNWFENIQGTFDLIVSNPPYIPALDIPNLEIEVRNHDPHLALDGGEDGLTCYRSIAAGASKHLNPNGVIAVEIGAGQAPDIEAIFNSHGFARTAHKRDLGNHIRCLAFQKSPQSP